MGEEMLEIITERKNDLSLGRRIKREEKQVAKHYREEYKKMQYARSELVAGRLEFDAY